MKRLITLIVGVTLVAALLAFSVESKGQVKNLLSTYNLTSDTVVNTATAYLTVQSKGPAETVTIQFTATEISGTTAGTVTLLGSVDGTNFKALTVQEATTAIPTYTATDVASQTNLWVIKNNPYQYYRVSWTGTGTMSARFSAQLLLH